MLLMIVIVAVIDAVSESVKIPGAAWAWFIVLWLLVQACKEAAKPQKQPAISTVQAREIDWLISPDKEGIYSSVDGDWQIINVAGEFVLTGEDEQVINLTATKLAAAMDQAETIISAVTLRK